MAYKTKYMRYIEELQKRIPDVLEGFEYYGYTHSDYSFFYPYNECFDIELCPENFYSKKMEVDKWNICLWQNIFGSDGYILLKHEQIEDENEIPKKVEEYCNYISNLPDD